MNKKVLMITDLEGISGIAKIEQVMDTDSPDYIHSREYLMADTNAAIAGCFDAGAEAVYVWDGHGGGKNFIPGTLDPRATQIDSSTIMDIIRGCDVLMLVGMHAMSGTAKAFLDHTQSSATIFDYKYTASAAARSRRSVSLQDTSAFRVSWSPVTARRVRKQKNCFRA